MMPQMASVTTLTICHAIESKFALIGAKVLIGLSQILDAAR
jgi:hypothetical protein